MITNTLTAGQLILALAQYRADTPVLISIDAEGNDFKPISETDLSEDKGYATHPQHAWIIDTYWHEEDDVPQDEQAIVIWPVN